MGTYAIIVLMDSDENISMWRLDTSAGHVVMIFSDMGKLAEVAAYAERYGKRPDHRVAKVSFTAASAAQVLPEVEKLRLTMGADAMPYVTEGEERFNDLLAQIREQNATSG